MTQEREVMEVDVLYVGGGVASLSSALHLSNLINAHNAKGEGKKLDEVMVAVLEKGAYFGAHGISGAVMAPGPLKELIPDYLDKGAPIEGEVTKESIYLLTERGKIKSPITPPPLNNHGNVVISMAKMNQWLAGLVEENGVYMFPSFAGVELLYDGDRVIGVRTGDKGVGPDGQKKPNYEPGADVIARVVVLGEGSRGSLTKEVIKRFGLDRGKNPPGFEVGVKEVWEIPAGRIEPGEVIHTMGYPLKSDTFGGGFIYGMKDNLVCLGHLTSLDYSDPFIDPHREFQRFKLHPLVRGLLEGGKLVQYGAKTAPVGGYYSIPKLTFPGGLLIGDGANLFNAQKIKGVDIAMRSGMLAAEVIFAALVNDDFSESRLAAYEQAMAETKEMKDLYKVRNFHQAMTRGLYLGLLTAAAQYVLGGRVLKNRLPATPDHTHLKTVAEKYGTTTPSPEAVRDFKYDGKLTFDKETDVYYSGTVHEEAQPSHLKIKSLDICYGECATRYQYPCVRFCPAGVYEIEVDESTGQKSLKINFSNCVHCKTCDVKDPFENIQWVPPEGGGGPKYTVV
ncbi:MAG: electron transfer flavoprotein-ubiquinone oxidoreductase [Thermoleophilia bacterium]|nr:electron transfer flavoprotein-ubiquinone oxidoreductase [Thermoleophilia bacterium]